MIAKIILVVSCLGVVRAGLINVPNSDDEKNDVNTMDVKRSSMENDFSTNEIVAESFGAASGASSTRACTHNVCNTFCWLNGYAWGHCVSANVCRCYRLWVAFNENNPDNEHQGEQRAEKVGATEDVSHKDIDDEFNDARDFHTEKLVSENNFESAVGLASARACTNNFCNTFCRLNGYVWGHCISANVCRCYRTRMGYNEINNVVDHEELNVRTMDKGAKEADDFSLEQIQPENKLESGAVSDAVSARACTHNVCNTFCRLNGYTWGHCISANVCRCYRMW